MYNPCLFQQLPVFADNIMRHGAYYPTATSTTQSNAATVKMTTSKNQHGLTLTFTKPLPSNVYRQAIENEFYQLKQNQKPTYQMVTDFFGNQYYITKPTEQISEQQLLQQIDFNSIGRKLAKEQFQDYSLELSHDGSQLIVSSPNDDINEPLQFNSIIADFKVAGCGVVNDNTAVLKIDVVFEENFSNCLEAKYQRMEQEEEKKKLTALREAQRIAEEKEERLRKVQEAKRAAMEQARLRKVQEAQRVAMEQAKLRQLAELKAKEEHDKKVALKKQYLEEKKRQYRENQERLRREYDIKMRRQQEKQDKLRREYEAQVKRHQQEEEERIRREEQEEDEKLKRAQKLQEQIEYQKRLVEEEKQMKEIKRKQEQEKKASASSASSSSSPLNDDVVKINIQFKNDGATSHQQDSDYESSSVVSDSDSDDHSYDSDISHPLRRHSSPVLEEVEDDEMSRYHESLSKSPRGTSILEDA